MAEPGWVRIQSNTFKNWVNIRMTPLGVQVGDLRTDLCNGVNLIKLIEVLSGKKGPKYGAAPKMRSQIMDNVSIALNFLKAQGLKLVNVGPEDVADGNHKLILGMIWIIIQKYQILQDAGDSGKGARSALLEWVRNRIPTRNVNNFTSDWNSGDTILDLTNSLIPGSVPKNAYNKTPLEKAKLASDIAQNQMKIPPLLAPEDLIDSNVDEQSVMTYISLFKEWNKAEVSTSLTEVSLKEGDIIHIRTIDKNGDVVVYGGHEFRVTTSDEDSQSDTPRSNNSDTTSHTFYWEHGGDSAGVGGSFNDWNVEPMDQDKEGNFSLTIDGFDPNVLHHFKYNIDGEWKVDPEQPVDDSEKVNGRTVVYNAIIPKKSNGSKSRESTTRSTETDWPVKDNKDGTFTSHFERNKNAGEPTVVVVYYQNNEIKRYVIEPEEVPKAVGASVKVEDQSHVRVHALDSNKKELENGGDNFTATYEQNGAKSQVKLVDHNDGTYSGRFDRDSDYEGKLVVLLDKNQVHTETFAPKVRQPSGDHSKVTVKGDALLIHAIDANNKPCVVGGAHYTAEVTQDGKKTPVNVRDLNNGKYDGQLSIDPDTDAVVTVFLNGNKIHTETVKATQERKAHGQSCKVNANNKHVDIKAFDQKGRALNEGGENFTAELIQNGASKTVLLKDNKNGTYEGDYEISPEYDATLVTNLNGQLIHTESFKATRPAADLSKTKVEVKDGKVTIKAVTKDGEPAKHSDGHFVAKLEQSGKEESIPLVNHGDGTYSGSFTVPDTKKDAIVRVFHNATHAGESPYVIPRVPAKVSATRSTAKLDGDKVQIQAYDDDGEKLTSGGDKFRVEVIQEGKKTVVPVKDNKNGTYTSASLPLLPSEDAVIDVTYERQAVFGTPFNIKAAQVKADKVTTFVSVADGVVTIEPKDSQGFPAPGFHNAFKATVEQDGESKEINLKEGRDGKFVGDFEVDEYEPAKVSVLLHGEHVGDSPFHLQAKEKPKEAPKAVSGKVSISDGKLRVVSFDKNGAPMKTGGAPFAADISQDGKIKKIQLKDEGDGTYSGKYDMDEEKDAIVAVDLEGKRIHKEELKGAVRKAYGPNTKVKTENGNYVHIESYDSKGREVPTGDAPFTAEVVQKGKSRPVILEDHEDGTYDGRFERDSDYDAVLNVYHDNQKVYTENFKATKRAIAPTNTRVSCDKGEVTIKTYDANKKALIHGGNNFTAEMVQNGKKVAVPLTDNRDGTYKGKYEQDPFHDGQINVYQEGKQIHTENLKKSKSKPVDPLKCIVKVNGGDILIEARDKDGQKINEGGHNFAATVTRGPATEKIAIKDHGDGKYTGRFVENSEVESILDFTQDGNPVCTYRIKPVGVKEVPVPQLHPEDVGEVQVFQTQVSIGEKQLQISTFDADGNPMNLVKPIVDPVTKVVRQEQFKAFYQGAGVGRVNIELFPKENGILISEEYRLKHVGEYKFHVLYAKKDLQGSPYIYQLSGDLSIEAEETATTLDMSKPAWLRYGDSYTRYNGKPPGHIMVYFPETSDLHFYHVPMGQSTELTEDVVKLNAQSTGLALGLQRVVPTTSDAILFYNNKTGEVQSAKVNEERLLSPLKVMKETKPSKKWKHIVPIDVNGQHAVLFYERGTGRAQIRQVTTHGELVVRSESNEWNKNWDRVTPIQVGDKTALFLYDAGKKKADISFIDSSCNLNTTGTSSGLSEKWKHVVGLTPGYVLFMEKKSGAGQINRVDTKGSKKLRSFKTDKNTWTSVEFIAHNRQVVFFSKKTGLAQFWDWDHREGRLKLAFTHEWKGAKFVAASY
eukprot:TRINITY_DN1430_c0_g1_i1.p1 TRINITY_DN1430_c0_g1~~TRINITY_DN1430_c0_g1_i1.p1  ORF type:complete len:1795 (-),score=714.68 TRINITY_DN1430_c0_g1_i1:199-5583(-)